MKPLTLGKNLFIRRIDEVTSEEAAAWDQLLMQDDVRRAFMSRSYASAVAQTGRDVVVLILYEETIPCGFLPLQKATGLCGAARIFAPGGA